MRDEIDCVIAIDCVTSPNTVIIGGYGQLPFVLPEVKKYANSFLYEIFVLFSVATDVMTVKLSLEDLENTASSMEQLGMLSLNCRLPVQLEHCNDFFRNVI